jgi:tetratricopeptide (TPR) repeat protein
MLRRIACVVLIIFTGVSCSRDPEVVKKKYLQNGNRYFEKGKYKEAYIMYRNALKKDSKYSEAYYRTALTELRMTKPLDALRDFRRAIDTDPNFSIPDARVQAGNILLVGYLVREDRPAALRSDLQKMSDDLLKNNPKSVPALKFKGYLKLIADHDPKAAIAQFRLASQISPSDPQITLPLIESLIADGQGAEAEKLGAELLQKQKHLLAAYDLLFGYYARANRPHEAEAVLKLKAANNPKEAAALIELAQFYYRSQRPADMQSALDKLSSNPKDFPDGRLRAGRFYAMIRDFDAAIRQFQEASRQDPDKKADYQKEIAQVLIVENKKDEAARLLDQILKANSKDAAAQSMRASLMIETGDPKQLQQAVAELQSAVGQQPGNAVLRFNLGRALLTKGLLDQAQVQFQEAIKIRPRYLPARLTLAQIYLAKHEYGSALRETDAALESDQRNLNAKLIRISALAGMGNSTQARAELVDTIKLYPNSVEAALHLAAMDLSERHYREAEDAFLKLHKAVPADLRPLFGLTETYAAQNQLDKAIQVLQEELVKNPSRLELRSQLGNLAYRAGNFALAIQQYQAIVDARPDAMDVYPRLGQAYAMKGDMASAFRALDKARQLKPNDPHVYLELAVLLEKAGKPAQARPMYEQVLKLQPDNPFALNNLAYIITEGGGDLDQALAFAQRARQKLPEDPDVADTLGWIYIKKNLSDNAINILRELVTKKPEVSTFHYHLAMALYQRGDKPEARKELQGALERKPSPEETIKIKELMGRIG